MYNFFKKVCIKKIGGSWPPLGFNEALPLRTNDVHIHEILNTIVEFKLFNHQLKLKNTIKIVK